LDVERPPNVLLHSSPRILHPVYNYDLLVAKLN
jgi:hypothetical protein